jgi:hypothetical protein
MKNYSNSSSDDINEVLSPPQMNVTEPAGPEKQNGTCFICDDERTLYLPSLGRILPWSVWAEVGMQPYSGQMKN